LDDLTDVTAPTPIIGEVLTWDGSAWVSGDMVHNSPGIGVSLFNASPTITATSADNELPLFNLSRTPITTAEQTVSGTASGNTVAFCAWLSQALDRTSIDAGIWTLKTFGRVNTAGQTVNLTRQIYNALPFLTGTVSITGAGTSRTATASAGTPFATANIDASATNTTASYLQTPLGMYQISARTSDTEVTIIVPTGYTNETAVAASVWKKLFGTTFPDVNAVSPDWQELETESAQPSFTIAATSKLGIISFVTCAVTRTITIAYDGSTHHAYVTTPIAPLHNEVGGLQGGAATEYYHLSSAELTELNTPHALLAGDSTQDFDIADLEVTGNITLTGAARRILGDFSNVTIASKTMLQSSTVDGNSIVEILPNGAATIASLVSCNSSDPANCAFATIGCTATAANFNTNKRGTGTALPLQFNINGAQRVSFETTGFVTFHIGITIPVVIAPTLLGSWVNVGAGTNPAGYWKDAYGVVHLQGFVQSGTGVIFTLPVGYRPATKLWFSGNDLFIVWANGDVEIGGPSASLTIEGATFRTT